MRRHLFSLILILGLAACRPAAAVPTPTLLPATSTPLPAATLTPVPTVPPEPAATPTPLPDGMLEFVFPHYESLSAAYPAADWQADKGMGQGSLVNSKIKGCEISDSSSEAPPEPLYTQRLGKLDYQTTRLQAANNPAVTWFFPPLELANKAAAGTEPVYFTVSAPVAVEADCLKAAGAVLATLGASGIQ